MGGDGQPCARQPLPARWRLCPTDAGAPAPGDGDPGWLACSQPQTVGAALREAGRWSLEQPPRDFDAQDWWYHARFDAPPASEPVLGLDGLATLTQAWLNGEPLLASDSMFLAHRVPLAGRLRPTRNELLLRFGSVQAALAQRRPRPRWRTPMVAHQQLRWIRTTLLGRTPGWTPPAAPVGPWRDVWWRDAAQAIDGRLETALQGTRGHCTLHLQVPPAWTQALEAAWFLLEGPDGSTHRQALAPGAGGDLQATLELPQVQRWWPHTHGEPALYQARLQVQQRSGREHTVVLGAVGFRTVEVDRTNDGFALRVNGERVFCRGAGWTPLDPVALRSSPQECAAALGQVREAGMNMLRLPGTLPPEEDHFYAECDALGLLVWQDFPFASMDYPLDDAAFAATAVAEARQLVQRLRAHPCLAVLCGNSEVEQQAAMWGTPRELWQPRFFHDALPRLCADEAPGVPYWPSSAHGGAFPHQASAGTTSYYGVGAYERPLDDARRSGLVFATECLAFANVPAPATLQRLPGGLATRVHHPQWKARSPRDLGAGWDFDDTRDHYVRELFGLDPARLRHADHDRYLALGRLASAEAMTAAFAEWRRAGSACSGALLLMLRDLWAGAGWGVLDDAGLPKSGWHALRRVLQPVAVLLTDEGGNGLLAHLVNETAAALDATLEVVAWRGATRVAQGQLPLTLAARATRAVSCIEVLGQFLDLNHAWRFGPPVCDAVQAKLRDAGGQVIGEAVRFPLGLAPRLAAPREIGLAARVLEAGDHAARLQVSTREWAIGVHLDLPGWTADDEHFHLAPGASRTMGLRRTGAARPLDGALHALNAADPVAIEAVA